MLDPRTGQPVTPDTMLPLKNGRQITAAKFYEQMNQLEAGLNKLGHSFRDQQKKVVTNEVVMDRTRTQGQIRRMPSARPSRGMDAQLDAVAQAHRDYIKTVNPHFGKRAPRGFSPRVRSGLYEQKVGALISQAGISATGPSAVIFAKQRPDFVPADSPVIGLNSDVETLPKVSTGPGWAEGMNYSTAIHIKTKSGEIGFFVNYLNAPTGQLAPGYVWQLVKAESSLDNFGQIDKAWATEFNNQELADWKTPPGLISSGSVNFLGSSKAFFPLKGHLFQIDFGKLVGNPPDNPPVNYLVRVVPVNADGSIAGYPSRPVLVTYGMQPELFPKMKLMSKPSKIPANNLDQQAPTAFGDSKVMSVNFNTWMKSNGTPGQQSASIGFDSGCSVYGVPYPLMQVSVGAELIPMQANEAEDEVISPGEAKGGVTILLGGILIPCDGCTKSYPTGLHYSYDKSANIDESFTLSFPIGPIDVSATIGIRGEVGVGGTGRLDVASRNPLRISAGPHLSASVYLEGAVGLGAGGFDVVQVGVKGNVNLISAGFVVRFDIGESGGYYSGQASALKVLNGTLDGYAEAGYCPFCKEWTTTLYSWEGYDLLAVEPKGRTFFAGKF